MPVSDDFTRWLKPSNIMHIGTDKVLVLVFVGFTLSMPLQTVAD